MYTEAGMATGFPACIKVEENAGLDIFNIVRVQDGIVTVKESFDVENLSTYNYVGRKERKFPV